MCFTYFCFEASPGKVGAGGIFQDDCVFFFFSYFYTKPSNFYLRGIRYSNIMSKYFVQMLTLSQNRMLVLENIHTILLLCSYLPSRSYNKPGC
ncbi:hypothetical protein GDO81_006569 [Engystomops pustulosus]|uniref:Uncharacterized protein n=1 Tax=Engystomops pustulosus TaxID=76066 RepID=A0AAV7CXR7_ENGPU|nr:hypothetical protein GDO81_006569 [Engystomops pustulosus]